MSNEPLASTIESPNESIGQSEEALETSEENKQESTEAPKEAAQKIESDKKVLNDPASSSKKKAAEKRIEKFKLKVHGKDIEDSVDLNDHNELSKRFQKAAAADRNMAEAAEVRKAAMQFIEELRKNPRKVLSDPNIGIDVRKFAEQIMQEAIEDMEKSPEQREREKLTKELEEIKAQREKEKKDWEQAEFSRLQAQHEQQLESEISSALDVGGLPKTARTVKAMAEMMMIALQNGIDLNAQEIVPIVKNTTLSEFKEVLNSLTDDQLEDFIGKDILGRVRKRSVAKAKAAVETASAIKPTAEGTKKVEDNKKAEKKQTIRDFLRV